MSNEKILEFSREETEIDYLNAAVMLKFLDAWERKGSDQEQTIRFSQIERRRHRDFALKTDGELIAIVNRGTSESWAQDTERFAAVLFELRRRDYFTDHAT